MARLLKKASQFGATGRPSMSLFSSVCSSKFIVIYGHACITVARVGSVSGIKMTWRGRGLVKNPYVFEADGETGSDAMNQLDGSRPLESPQQEIKIVRLIWATSIVGHTRGSMWPGASVYGEIETRVLTGRTSTPHSFRIIGQERQLSKLSAESNLLEIARYSGIKLTK